MKPPPPAMHVTEALEIAGVCLLGEEVRAKEDLALALGHRRGADVKSARRRIRRIIEAGDALMMAQVLLSYDSAPCPACGRRTTA